MSVFKLWQDLNIEWDLVTLLVMSGAGWLSLSVSVPGRALLQSSPVISVSHLLMVLLTERLRTPDSLSRQGWGSQFQIQVGGYGSVAEGGAGGRRGNFQWGHRLGEDLQSNLKENILRSSQFQFREAFKKKKSVTFVTLGGGQDQSSLHFFFFQKHGLKWLNIAF